MKWQFRHEVRGRAVLGGVAALVGCILVVASSDGVRAQSSSAEMGEKYALTQKPAVVRVITGCQGKVQYTSSNGRANKVYEESSISLGSGFFVNADGYILTNAHVTADYHDQDSCRSDLFDAYVIDLAKDNDINVKSLSQSELRDLVNIAKQRGRFTSFQPVNVVVIPNGTSLPYEIKTFGAPTGEGKDISVIKIEVKNAPVLKVGDSDKVALQEHITVIGYPGAADTNVLSKKSALEASFTDGKVSARKTTTDGAPVLQVSAPATHGNSGGPVLNDNGEVVGLLTFRGDTVNGQEVTGFSFIVPSNTAQEFVRQAGTASQLGPTDQLYREGLDLYFNRHYTAAIGKFEQVKRLFPQHSEVDTLTRQSQEAIAAGKDKPVVAQTKKSSSNNLGVVAGALGGGILLMILAAAAFFLMRSRRAAPQVAYAGPAAPGYLPPARPVASIAPARRPSAAAAGPLGGPTVIGSVPAELAVRAASLQVRTGAEVGRTWSLAAAETRIGRNADNDVVVLDRLVSGRHAQINRYQDGRYVLSDLQSSNGTTVNGVRVTQPVALRTGDVIGLGQSTVAFHG